MGCLGSALNSSVRRYGSVHHLLRCFNAVQIYRKDQWATNFWSCFFYFDFLVLLDVFWCAESENDVSFFVAFFCKLKIPEFWK